MENAISQKKNTKDSKYKSIAVNNPPGYKAHGFDPAIHLYEIKDSDSNEEGEQAQIIVITTKS